MRRTTWTLALGLAAFAATGQEPTPPFLSEVELVGLDVVVVDPAGRPVVDLDTSDFSVEIGGSPRKLVTSEYVRVADSSSSTTAPEMPSDISTNETSLPGRMVLFVVDTNGIPRGRGREVINAARAMIEKLTPADQVGLLTIPTSGQREEFTRDHARVAKALKWVVGTQSAPAAESFVREGEAQSSRFNTREILLETFGALQAVEGRKVVIFISQSLPSTGESYRDALASAAGRAKVSLYVVPVEDKTLISADADASPSMNQASSLSDFQALEELAVDTRGAVLRGTPSTAFTRILAETSGYYRIGFEPESARDITSKDKAVRVSVTRPGLTVRGRQLVRIDSSATARQKKDALVASLKSPTKATDLALRVGAWVLRAPQPEKVKLLVGAEIAGGTREVGLQVGWVLLDGQEQVVASATQAIPGSAEVRLSGAIPYATAVNVPPGTYTLRLAARDDRGRLGRVDHTVDATLEVAGHLLLSDLLVGPIPAPGRPFRPALLPDARRPLVVHGEVYADKDATLSDVTARLDVVSAVSDTTLRQVPVRLSRSDTGDRLLAQATFDGKGLAPGRYSARLSISAAGDTWAMKRAFSVPSETAEAMSPGPPPE